MSHITTYYKDDMLFETKIGEHSIMIDVPESMGGHDRGPMPPQLFIASLGSCVGAFVASYCREHDLDASGMTVDFEFGKESNPTRLTDFKVVVNLPNADITRKEEVLRRVAEHCPVHETIRAFEGMSIDIVGKAAVEML